MMDWHKLLQDFVLLLVAVNPLLVVSEFLASHRHGSLVAVHMGHFHSTVHGGESSRLGPDARDQKRLVCIPPWQALSLSIVGHNDWPTV